MTHGRRVRTSTLVWHPQQWVSPLGGPQSANYYTADVTTTVPDLATGVPVERTMFVRMYERSWHVVYERSSGDPF